jgi:hypothetical protein
VYWLVAALAVGVVIMLAVVPRCETELDHGSGNHDKARSYAVSHGP